MDDIEDLEIRLLLEGVKEVYGYDFSAYAETSLKRRLKAWLLKSTFKTFTDALSRLLRDPPLFESLLHGITVNVTDMFRDPLFFVALREKVIPHLRTYSFIKIWHAGCATGEEVYSMAILLHEEGLQGRYRIYATDIDEAVVNQAREGIFPLKLMQNFIDNYHHSGGKASFADYYTAAYDRAIFDASLKKDIVFSQHNLANDSHLGEMHLILCRNVMIYFKPVLKERCMHLFNNSLLPRGFLCLGTKEKLAQNFLSAPYENIDKHLSIYRKSYE
jgi:chemotaxis protein methyltransferase CheR